MSEASDEWLLWPEAVAWLLCQDKAIAAEIGHWFYDRMGENRSAAIVYAIRMSEIALDRLQLPEGEYARTQAAAAALVIAERDLMRMLERGACEARGKRSEFSSPELIPAWDWSDSIITASRTFELRGALRREVKFFDVRIAASGLPSWKDKPLSSSIEEAREQSSSPPWSEQRMREAISACSIRNRDQAWNEEFRPRYADHQWNVRAFREIWSVARGTKGMIGRPEKRAPKDAL